MNRDALLFGTMLAVAGAVPLFTGSTLPARAACYPPAAGAPSSQANCGIVDSYIDANGNSQIITSGFPLPVYTQQQTLGGGCGSIGTPYVSGHANFGTQDVSGQGCVSAAEGLPGLPANAWNFKQVDSVGSGLASTLTQGAAPNSGLNINCQYRATPQSMVDLNSAGVSCGPYNEFLVSLVDLNNNRYDPTKAAKVFGAGPLTHISVSGSAFDTLISNVPTYLQKLTIAAPGTSGSISLWDASGTPCSGGTLISSIPTASMPVYATSLLYEGGPTIRGLCATSSGVGQDITITSITP